MKAIKIIGLNLPDKTSVYTNNLRYTINLGNGIKKSFDNKAKAQKFLNEVSKYLTYKLHECNELYICVFTLYRRAWFYFDHNKPGSNFADLYAKDRLCEAHMIGITETFNILYKRANWANGNHFVFVHFNNILHALIETLNVLMELYAGRSAGAINYEIEILKTKVVYCKRTIDNYTVELENEFKESEQLSASLLKVV